MDPIEKCFIIIVNPWHWVCNDNVSRQLILLAQLLLSFIIVMVFVCSRQSRNYSQEIDDLWMNYRRGSFDFIFIVKACERHKVSFVITSRHASLTLWSDQNNTEVGGKGKLREKGVYQCPVTSLSHKPFCLHLVDVTVLMFFGPGLEVKAC